jgi:hypothetical protein
MMPVSNHYHTYQHIIAKTYSSTRSRGATKSSQHKGVLFPEGFNGMRAFPMKYTPEIRVCDWHYWLLIIGRTQCADEANFKVLFSVYCLQFIQV